MTDTFPNYICINCGAKVKELFKKYSSTVLKLTSCEQCQQIADKYIEYDPIIIIIDLILLNREAYRHILFNTGFESHWKLAIILQLMEAYSEWVLVSPTHYKTDFDSKKPIILENFHAGDLEFYKNFFKVVFRTISFFTIVYLLTILYNAIVKNSKKMRDSFWDILKCITLSSFGIFLFLPSLIWDGNIVQEYHLIFVTLYITLSQLLAYTVICNCSKMWSIIVIIIAYFCKIKSFDFCNSVNDNIYNNYFVNQNMSECIE